MNHINLPASDGTNPIKFGNMPGHHFYNTLNYKRVKGKHKVRGEHKYVFSTEPGVSNYSPAEWKEHGPNPPKNKKKKNETASETSN